MTVQTTRPFDRDYARLPTGLKDRVDRQIALLLSDPHHPSLRLKKMEGTLSIWEARVTRSYRLTLEIRGDTYILRRVGPHDVLKTP
jgi:hypothetical protein